MSGLAKQRCLRSCPTLSRGVLAVITATGQGLACLTQIHGSGRVAVGRGGRVAVPPARGAVPCFPS